MRYQSFAEFWPHYLREHAKPSTRMYHYIGTGLGLVVAATALITLNFWLLLLMPLLGYGFAWVSHAFVERNKPATFTYPFWSLMGDQKMFGLAIIGKLRPELEKAGVSLDPQTAELRSSPNQ